MRLEIISPEKVFFDGTVDSVTVPGSKGSFTVLPHHAAIISTLRKGNVVYKIGKEENQLAIESGIIEVRNDIVSICIE